MSKKRLALHGLSISLLSIPNLTYLGCNFSIIKEANAVALSMTALLILAVIGLGALAHIKANGGIWAALIGIFILSLSNIAYVAGIALIVEGAGISIDGYVIKPLIIKEKVKELEENGQSVTYTTSIK